MKNIITIIILFLSLSVKGQQDMNIYLKETQEMVKQGKYKEALERFVWFHDHVLEYNKAMSGVRLSFALSYWKSLGDVYPPALAALIEMRDRKSKQLIDEASTSNLFPEVAALNRTLGDNSKTVDLFIMLDKTYPDIAKKFFRYAQDILFVAKRYDILSNYISNPSNEFDQLKLFYNMNIELSKKLPNENTAVLNKTFNDQRFADKSLQLIELALFNNDIKTAKEIQEKAISVVTDYRIKNAIPGDKKN